jgi:hypothetical protein
MERLQAAGSFQLRNHRKRPQAFSHCGHRDQNTSVIKASIRQPRPQTLLHLHKQEESNLAFPTTEHARCCRRVPHLKSYSSLSFRLPNAFPCDWIGHALDITVGASARGRCAKVDLAISYIDGIEYGRLDRQSGFNFGCVGDAKKLP